MCGGVDGRTMLEGRCHVAADASKATADVLQLKVEGSSRVSISSYLMFKHRAEMVVARLLK